MDIQKCYACVYISFERVKVNGAAQKWKDTPYERLQFALQAAGS